jgi:hypothetical protein
MCALAAAAALVMASCSNIVGHGDALGLDGAPRALQAVNTAPALYNYVFQNYNSTVGPIAIVRGTLSDSSGSKAIYLVSLSGTQMKSNQATGILNDLQAGCSIQGAYVIAIKNAICGNVPNGSNLVLAGHSLGGMVAQQVAGDSTIKSRYNVLNTVGFGAPLITFITREGTVRRLGDTADVVPIASVSSLFVVTAVWNYAGLNRENGGYGSNILGAHLDSYKRSDVWGAYDAVGTKNGSAKLSIDLATRQQFAAPSGWVKFKY